jgi:hypothetical protein
MPNMNELSGIIYPDKLVDHQHVYHQLLVDLKKWFTNYLTRKIPEKEPRDKFMPSSGACYESSPKKSDSSIPESGTKKQLRKGVLAKRSA